MIFFMNLKDILISLAAGAAIVVVTAIVKVLRRNTEKKE